MSTDNDDVDDFDLPVTEDVISTGAAADSANWDERLKGLPRLLRYAMPTIERTGHLEERLVAEIEELCPQLPQNKAWAISGTLEAGLALAAELDRRAVVQDEPNLRSLADCIRLVSLPTPRERYFREYRRVGKALVQAFNAASPHAEERLCCDLERFTFGWAGLPVATHMLPRGVSAAMNAAFLGNIVAKHRISAVKAAARREEEERRRNREVENKHAAIQTQVAASAEAVPEHHLLVAHLSTEELKNTKLKDILAPLKSVISVPLPLTKVPPLHEARAALLFEFPYAVDVIDFALVDLVGRETVHLRPLLIEGEPGGGKSRFARRLGEILGVSVWRTDASQSDGTVFGGTDRRWYSAEPCHAFLAIAKSKIANPLVLIDEIEKAATRSDYGRLWDSLLGFLEPETNSRYPDPALQTNLDLSQVSYVATANSVDPLPSPIRDRFRVVKFPKPTANDLEALLPAVMADLVRERRLDPCWFPPLDTMERAAVAEYWRGGSVRRLRRIVEAILRERELSAARN